MSAAKKNPLGDFEVLVGPLRREMVLLARRLTRSDATADDIVQDAMLRAWRAWPTWVPKFAKNVEVTASSTNQLLRQWLVRITFNTFGNYYQRVHVAEMRAYGSEVDEGTICEAGEAAHGEMPPAPDRVVDDAFSDEVTEALDAILPDRRDVLLLSASGLNTSEIASVVGMPQGTAFSRLFRARADMSARLSEYAAREYGIGPLASGRARVDAARDEAPEVVETDADRVDDVVRGDDHGLSLAL